LGLFIRLLRSPASPFTFCNSTFGFLPIECCKFLTNAGQKHIETFLQTLASVLIHSLLYETFDVEALISTTKQAKYLWVIKSKKAISE